MDRQDHCSSNAALDGLFLVCRLMDYSIFGSYIRFQKGHLDFQRPSILQPLNRCSRRHRRNRNPSFLPLPIPPAFTGLVPIQPQRQLAAGCGLRLPHVPFSQPSLTSQPQSLPDAPPCPRHRFQRGTVHPCAGPGRDGGLCGCGVGVCPRLGGGSV